VSAVGGELPSGGFAAVCSSGDRPASGEAAEPKSGKAIEEYAI
jgi:hypothetical protein